MSSAANTLIVPIHLDAICVSPLDDDKSGFAPATLQRLEDLPFHGDGKSPQVAAVSQHFHSPPFTSGGLEPGVHLHWALPDALTHGRHVHQVTGDALTEMRCLGVSPEVIAVVQHGINPAQVFKSDDQLIEQLSKLMPNVMLAAYQGLIVQATGRFDFPHAPNRWLLVRLITDAKGTDPNVNSWVIESDFLSTNNKYAGHTQVPFDKYDLNLMKLDSPDDLPEKGKCTVIVAKIGDAYYARIFDKSGKQVTDKGNEEFFLEAKLFKELDKALRGHSINNRIKSKLIRKISSSLGHTVSDKPWRYMGRARAVRQGVSWQEDVAAERYPNLTALGYGELSFAAYYPNCHSVFGHHDTVGELQATTYVPGTSRLTYAVIGWHSDATSDPLVQARDITKTLAELAWSVSEAGAAGSLQRSVYYGIVHDLQWDETKPVSQYAANVTEPIELAVGNTAAEALAAYLGRHTPPSESQEGGRQISAETLIEALQLDLLSEIHLADGDFEQLEHALHEQAFRAHPGGSEWIIGKTLAAHDGPQTPAQHFDQRAHAGAFTPVPLAPEIADKLSALNELQRHYDSLQFETLERRWQLFADWHHSMLIAYPGLPSSHPDLQKESLTKAYHNLVTSGVTKLEAAFAELAHLAELAVHDATALQTEIGPDYTLRRVAAPRFWQPNDPTLLLAGTDVDPSLRYGSDTLFGEDSALACRVGFEVIGALGDGGQIAAESLQRPKLGVDLDAALFDALLTEVVLINRFFAGPAGRLKSTDIAAGRVPAAIALNRWGNAAHSGRNPWHPLMLHWEIDPATIKKKTKEKREIPGNSEGARGFVKGNATLLPHSLDLTYKDKAIAAVDASHPYQGIVLLTPHATKTLASQLQRLLPDGLDETLKQELEHLPIMSQVIRGFNDSLLMRAQQNQFRIENPYNPQQIAPPGLPAFDPPLWKKVQAAVGRMNNAAPLPHARYTPIRSGFAKIRRLWLVDAFGQYKAFEGDTLPKAIAASTMRPPAAQKDKADFTLVPRVVQPSRLMMRWVSAENPTRFMNAHPDTTPICGWVLPNHLDHSLMIYDNAGQPLGSLRGNVPVANRWEAAPGCTSPSTPSQIDNPILQRMVAYLLTLDETAFSNYLQAIEQVLLTIEPPTYREHNALPVLMGRPLALAQVHLTAELKGLPAVDQSYETLTKMINEQPKRENAPADSLRTWHNFTAIELPLRLGDIVTERDGLVCTFSRDDKKFTAHQLEVDAEGNHDRDDADDLWLSLSTRHAKLEYYEIKKGDTLRAISKEFYNNGAKYTKIFEANREVIKDPDLIFPGQKIRIPDANGVTVPLLLDPRAKIHATTGFLPVQSLAIPPEFYNHVLQRMALTFLVNPLLSVDTPLTLPLPAETTHTWAWYDPKHGWDAALAPSDDRAHLDTVRQQIREGWLRMRPYDNDKKA